MRLGKMGLGKFCALYRIAKFSKSDLSGVWGILMRVDFLDFTRNFKEFLAVHSFLCFLILVYSMWLFWVFAHFLCLWRVAFSLMKR